MDTNPFTIVGMSNSVLELIPDMLVLYDRNATIIDILNPKPELMNGTVEQTIGRKLTEGTLKEKYEPYFSYFHKVCETCQPQQFLYRHKGNDGKEKFYEIVLSSVEDKFVMADIRTITERSVASIESQHLRCFFDEVLDNIAIPVTVKSVDTERYIYWSKKAEIFGRTAVEMEGGTDELYMTPEQADTVREIDRKLANGKEKQYKGIEKYTINDGKEHTFIVTRTLFFFGEEKLILSSALDISELTETKTSLLNAKKELAHKNMTLSSILSLAKVIPWECDLVKRTFYCDYKYYHSDNAGGPDEHGRYIIPMDSYFASIHPDHRAEAVSLIEELSEGKIDDFHDTYQVHWFNDRDWEWVSVQSSVSRRSPDGRPVQLIGSAQRVTEQKQNEIELREAKESLNVKNVILSSVLSIAHVLPWVGDLTSGVFYCDYTLHHHEDSKVPDAQGHYTVPLRKYFDKIHPDYRAHAYDQYVDMIEGRLSEYHETYPILWNNDSDYEWLEIQGSVFKHDANGKALEIIGSARVVTFQKRLEDSLREAKEEAERSNKFKSAFLANMSHEIRTPLNAIVGFSELLSQAESDTEKQEYLDIIRNSNALLLQLIADILDLSKIEAGTLEFTFADHDLNAMMEELETTSRMKVNNPAINVSCTDRTSEAKIYTDRGRLMQVFHNFIGNAAKFTKKGHIHFGYKKQVDGRWYFYVEDTGCGISSDKVENVFERFVKLDKGTKGTGLGLAISKSIIERLGGEIGVYSAEGQGSTFWFSLPVGSVSTSEYVRGTHEKLSSSTSPEKDTVTILVAEDDSANYKLFEAILKKHYTLLHAWNGRQAVEMFKENRPDMILMDIKMPEMDGYEATATIREMSPTVPIVAVTAFAYPDDMRRILASGFNGCLPKPVSADKLKKKISELCADHH